MRSLAIFSLALVGLSFACSSSSTGGANPSNQQGSSSGATGDDGGTGSPGSSGAGSSGTGTSSGAASSGSQSGSGGGSSSGASTSSGGGGSSSGGTSSGADASSSYGPYPSGPYCTPAGSGGHLTPPCVLPNMTFVGYVDPAADALATTKTKGNYSFDDVRKSGHRWAMINVAEFQCPGCDQSAQELGAMGAAVVHAGGVVIEDLETDGFQNCPLQGDLEAWITKSTHNLFTTTVQDTTSGGAACISQSLLSGTPSPSLAFFGRRDQAYIIDLKTMTVTQYVNGSIGPVPGGLNSAGLALQALDSLLMSDGGGGG